MLRVNPLPPIGGYRLSPRPAAFQPLPHLLRISFPHPLSALRLNLLQGVNTGANFHTFIASLEFCFSILTSEEWGLMYGEETQRHGSRFATRK